MIVSTVISNEEILRQKFRELYVYDLNRSRDNNFLV